MGAFLRRRLPWVLSAALADALLTGGAAWWLRPGPTITLEAFYQIRDGMTGAEVEAVLVTSGAGSRSGITMQLQAPGRPVLARSHFSARARFRSRFRCREKRSSRYW